MVSGRPGLVTSSYGFSRPLPSQRMWGPPMRGPGTGGPDVPEFSPHGPAGCRCGGRRPRQQVPSARPRPQDRTRPVGSRRARPVLVLLALVRCRAPRSARAVPAALLPTAHPGPGRSSCRRGPRCGVGQGCKRGKEEGPFQLLVSPLGGLLPADRGPRTAGRGCDSCVGGKVAGGREGAAVADFDQDAGSGPDAESWTELAGRRRKPRQPHHRPQRRPLPGRRNPGRWHRLTPRRRGRVMPRPARPPYADGSFPPADR